MEASDNTMVINTRYPKAFLCPLCHSGVPEPQEGWGQSRVLHLAPHSEGVT